MRGAIYDRKEAIQKLKELDIARLLKLENDLETLYECTPEDEDKKQIKSGDFPKVITPKLTRREIKVLWDLIQLTKTKYSILNKFPEKNIPASYDVIYGQDVVREFIDIFYTEEVFNELFPDEADEQKKKIQPTLGLIKLITSSKAIENHYSDLCYSLAIRFGLKTLPITEKKTTRRLIAEWTGRALTVGNSLALGFLLAGGFIILTTSFAFLSLAFVPTLIIASLFLIAGMVAGYNMGIESLPDILTKIIGEEKFLDTLLCDDRGKQLSRRQMGLLLVGCGFALSTGILTAAFGYSSGLLFMGMLATLPVIGAVSSIFPPLAIALLIISASSIFFMMYQSFHELIQIEHPWQELKKYFKELLDPDAARHRVLNKTPFRVYLEFALTMIIMPLAIGGMVATALSFIPGLAHLSLKALPRTPMAIADVVSSFVGLIAMFGETPFTLRTITTSVAELGQSVVKFFQDFKIQQRVTYSLQAAKKEFHDLKVKLKIANDQQSKQTDVEFDKKVEANTQESKSEPSSEKTQENANKIIEDIRFELDSQDQYKLSALETMKLIGHYALSITAFLFRVVYAVAQAAIAFQGANVGGLTASGVGAACAFGNAYAEATTMGANINEFTRTDHILELIENFNDDIKRIDRKEAEYEKEASFISSKEEVEESEIDVGQKTKSSFQPLFLLNKEDSNLHKRSDRISANEYFLKKDTQSPSPYQKATHALTVDKITYSSFESEFTPTKSFQL